MFLRKLDWLVLRVKLMEIYSNGCFSGTVDGRLSAPRK